LCKADSRKLFNPSASAARRTSEPGRRAAEAEGLKSLRDSALHKVFSGVSTLHEINRVTFVEELSAIG